MSCICIITPVVIATWPALSAAVTAAATSLGYTVMKKATEELQGQRQTRSGRVQLEMPRSEVVTDTLGRDQRISVSREGVTVTFARDARGRASLCVTGAGHSDEALRAQGEELSQRVVQQYVYQRLTQEIQQRGFMVVQEQTGTDRSIRLKVRHWEA